MPIMVVVFYNMDTCPLGDGLRPPTHFT